MVDLEINEKPHSGILRIFLMGDNNVGVTTFFKKYCGGIIDQSSLSIFGTETSFKNLDGDEQKALQIWYVADILHNRFEIVKRTILPQSNGGIIMFDVSNRESFKNSKIYIESMLAKNISFLTLALIGNKIDLRGQLSESVTDEEAKNYCEKLTEEYEVAPFKIKYFPLSAKADTETEECFNYLFDTYMKYRNSLPKILVIGEKETNARIFYRKNIIETEFLSTDTIVKTFQYNEWKIGIEFISLAFYLKNTLSDFIKQRAYYYERAKGIIILLDVTNRETLNQADEFVNEFLQYNTAEKLLIVILGDDVTTRDNNPNHISDEEAENYCSKVLEEAKRPGLKVQFYPISIETHLNIENCFKSIVENLTLKDDPK